MIQLNKIILTAACLLPAFAAQAQNAEQITAPEGYKLVWHDEFNGEGAPDPSSWTPEEGFVRNHEWQWYQADNARQSDGSLIITARRESRPNPTYREGSKNWGEQRKNIECTSSCYISKGKREFLYGRFEIRARIPASRGSWPAIWFHGSNWPWPSAGEVDLMEFYVRDGRRSILANACWGGENNQSAWNSGIIPFTHFTSKDSLWATQFHVWRMDWDKDFIKMYLDDELLNTIDLSKTFNGKGSAGEGQNPFRTPMYILLNLAMGSSGGPVEESTLPVRYEVDYVRVFQMK